MAIMRPGEARGVGGDLLDVDLVGAQREGAQQGGRGDHLHVGAGGAVVDRLEIHLGGRLAQLMQHADLGGHEHGTGAGSPRGVEHLAGGEHVDAPGCHDALTGEVDRGVGAAALGMDVEVGLWIGRGLAGQLRAGDGGVDVAFARPDVHVLPAGLALDVCAEELIRVEEDLAVGGQGIDHVGGVRGGAAHVGQRLHVGVLGPPLGQLRGGQGIGQGAAGALVGDEHGLPRGEDLRGFGHEVHPAEDDDVGVGLSGESRQPERITGMGGDVLALGQLIVVREDDGVAFGRQTADLGGPPVGGPQAGPATGAVGHVVEQRGRKRLQGPGHNEFSSVIPHD